MSLAEQDNIVRQPNPILILGRHFLDKSCRKMHLYQKIDAAISLWII